MNRRHSHPTSGSFIQPEGLQLVSPGQSPGDSSKPHSSALKGQNSHATIALKNKLQPLIQEARRSVSRTSFADSWSTTGPALCVGLTGRGSASDALVRAKKLRVGRVPRAIALGWRIAAPLARGKVESDELTWRCLALAWAGPWAVESLRLWREERSGRTSSPGVAGRCPAPMNRCAFGGKVRVSDHVYRLLYILAWRSRMKFAFGRFQSYTRAALAHCFLTSIASSMLPSNAFQRVSAC
jgi:hypothetical protein